VTKLLKTLDKRLSKLADEIQRSEEVAAALNKQLTPSKQQQQSTPPSPSTVPPDTSTAQSDVPRRLSRKETKLIKAQRMLQVYYVNDAVAREIYNLGQMTALYFSSLPPAVKAEHKQMLLAILDAVLHLVTEALHRLRWQSKLDRSLSQRCAMNVSNGWRETKNFVKRHPTLYWCAGTVICIAPLTIIAFGPYGLLAACAGFAAASAFIALSSMLFDDIAQSTKEERVWDPQVLILLQELTNIIRLGAGENIEQIQDELYAFMMRHQGDKVLIIPDDCGICLERIESPVTTNNEGCPHVFCRKCLKKAIHTGSVMCPICRRPFTKIQELSS